MSAVLQQFCSNEGQLETLSIGFKLDFNIILPQIQSGTIDVSNALKHLEEQNGHFGESTLTQLESCLGKIASGHCSLRNKT